MLILLLKFSISYKNENHDLKNQKKMLLLALQYQKILKDRATLVFFFARDIRANLSKKKGIVPKRARIQIDEAFTVCH